jgi:hypothetical protein
MAPVNVGSLLSYDAALLAEGESQSARGALVLACAADLPSTDARMRA